MANVDKMQVEEHRLDDQYLCLRTKHACMLSHFSHVQFFVAPWTVPCESPLFMGFPRQEYWSGLRKPITISITGIE